MLSLKYKFKRQIGLYPIAFGHEGMKYGNKRVTNSDSPIT